jgi:Alpha amylase, catalytic domain/Carbohydrate-binding module 48 (Isoamylase N-terminal domain)
MTIQKLRYPILISLFFGCFIARASAQVLSTTPHFPGDNSDISIAVDTEKGNLGLQNYSNPNDVYVHVGVITNLSSSPADWKYVKFTWGTTNAGAKAVSLGNNKFQYTINNIRSFFGVPSGEAILKVTILFRNGSGSLVQRNSDGSDMYIPVYGNALACKYLLPPYEPRFSPVPEPINVSVGDTVDVSYVSNKNGILSIYFNGTIVNTISSANSITASPSILSTGNQQIVAEVSDGTTAKSDTLAFFVAPPTKVEPLPTGVEDGINYLANDSSVILVLFAPGKNRVAVIGDFNNWQQQAGYLMNKTPDGKYFWLQIDGLLPTTEYGYQYQIDDVLLVPDYYTEKVLDPGRDPEISASTYPNLKPYPAGKTTGLISILQTKAPQYAWRNSNFTRADKRNLIIYELLLRDFIGNHDYKTLRDTLSYLKRLGINAIELMPFNEFEGNNSWGYNTSFYFAPDKYYGPKNTLKEFIDSCHSNGIAVIMDLVLNHSFGQSPMVQMYFNTGTGKTTPENPWFNENTPHAFGFGYDFNHESEATKYFVDRVLEFWLTEYKLDGFRLDFTKGLTQKSSANDAQFSAFDITRVNILKRINSFILSKSTDAYVILEHFCDNSEEIELASNGMLIWGNGNYNFNEATMGYLNNSNFDWYIHTRRGYAAPLLLGYMESHDEERLMYKNIKYGNSAGGYNIKDSMTAIKRNELASAFFLAIPGPKMIWQFGELAYDYSRCYLSTNGEGGDCNTKTDPKPVRWDFQQRAERKKLFDIHGALIKLRKDYPNPFIEGGGHL